jgi:hypothetical protein
MALDDREIARLLADPSKRILGPLRWTDDEDLSCGLEFAAELRAASGESLLVRGQRCDPAGSLRFALILRGVGRIAALDLGHPHQGPDGRRCTGLHFHRWSPPFRDHLAAPLTLPEGPRDPVDRAWQLFCRLTRIAHDGLLADPPPRQEILL